MPQVIEPICRSSPTERAGLMVAAFTALSSGTPKRTALRKQSASTVTLPSIALIADLVAKEVDFISIGTNDLTQYLCAADRMNPELRAYYQEYHPALVRILKHLADTFNAAGKGISVCGELAGDPLAVPLLIGLGIHSMSVGFASLAGTKQIVRRLTTEAARQLAEEVLALSTAEDIRRTLLAFSKQLEV